MPELSGDIKVITPEQVAAGRVNLINRLSALNAVALPVHPDDGRIARIGFRGRPIGNLDLTTIAREASAAKVPVMFDLQGSFGVSEEGIAELKSGVDLRGLNLLGTAVSTKVIDILVTIPGLEEVVLAGDQFGDAELARLVDALPNLHALTWMSRQLTEAGLAPLASRPQMRRLTLLPGSPAIGDAGLKSLASLSKLEAIELSGEDLTPRGLAAIEGMSGLRKLTLRNAPKLTGPALSSVGQLNGLTKLVITGCPLSDDDLIHLRTLKNLQRIELDPHFGDVAVEHLAAMTALESLDLSRHPITDASTKLLAELPHLTSLNLAETKISNPGVAALSKSSSLRELMLDDCDIGDTGTKELAALETLTLLSLAGTKTTDASAVVWPKLGKLKILNLSKTPVSDATVKALADHPALEELYLDGSAITDASAPAFRAIGKLKLLRIGKTKMTEQGITEVEELLKGRGVSVFGN